MRFTDGPFVSADLNVTHSRRGVKFAVEATRGSEAGLGGELWRVRSVPRLYTRVMPRGYEEGPVAEEAQRRIDAIERGASPDGPGAPATRAAVFGSTEQDGPARFLGWADEVDADELFESGRAWGISLRRIPR